jgi:transketolase
MVKSNEQKNRSELLAYDVRKKTIKLSCNTGAGHLAPSLSTVEFLTVLFRDFLRYNSSDPEWEGRDRLVFSKGHGAYAYYILLNELGFLPDEELANFYTPRASIKGCLTKNNKYMIEASTGSLGHGLPIAVGMAKSFKMRDLPNRVVCVVGDGEMQEGSNFEALQFAYRFGLDNLLVIVDANSLQAMDRVEDVGLDNVRLCKVMQAYCENSTFAVVDGHDECALKAAMHPFFSDDIALPGFSILFCNTTKGKGIGFMEGNVNYHFRCPTQDGYVPEME